MIEKNKWLTYFTITRTPFNPAIRKKHQATNSVRGSIATQAPANPSGQNVGESLKHLLKLYTWNNRQHLQCWMAENPTLQCRSENF